eukprot:3663-Heterococcus_DN1.PRE.2
MTILLGYIQRATASVPFNLNSVQGVRTKHIPRRATVLMAMYSRAATDISNVWTMIDMRRTLRTYGKWSCASMNTCASSCMTYMHYNDLTTMTALSIVVYIYVHPATVVLYLQSQYISEIQSNQQLFYTLYAAGQKALTKHRNELEECLEKCTDADSETQSNSNTTSIGAVCDEQIAQSAVQDAFTTIVHSARPVGSDSIIVTAANSSTWSIEELLQVNAALCKYVTNGLTATGLAGRQQKELPTSAQFLLDDT